MKKDVYDKFYKKVPQCQIERLKKFRSKHPHKHLIVDDTTCRLYDFGMKNNYLKFTDKWNNPGTVAVDFSYPINTNYFGKQISLF